MSEPKRPPIAKAQLLIRKPVREVFEAMVDPALTSRFWFSKGSGRLEAGQRVRWDWEMYGFHADVEVREVERDRRILVEWSGYDSPTPIEWRFEAFQLAGLKVFLEHGIEPGFVLDHSPEHLVAGWRR